MGKFKKLQVELYKTFTDGFWSDQEDNKSFRLGCCKKDYTIAYIDFIDFSKNRENWLGFKLPTTILLAGNGELNNPYYIDYTNDSYAKSIALIQFGFFKDKLPVFMENFNS